MCLAVIAACSTQTRVRADAADQSARTQANRGAPALGGESALGVEDRGVFSDLDARVQVVLPAGLSATQLHASVDATRKLLVLYEGPRPVKAYPLRDEGPVAFHIGQLPVRLRAADRAELTPLLDAERIALLAPHAQPAPGDADRDGIPDPLDVLLGAKKAELNADRYDGRYVRIAYPLGDVPRSIGVCTDVLVRSLRNAGIDLQRAVHEDIARAPRAYPMVERPNPNIDHRRVKSLLPYFERHFTAVDDTQPFWPGDIVFMDTFPDRPGSEHVGIVSDQVAASGWPLIINNWTDGTVTRAMQLLPSVPVTRRFRVPPQAATAANPLATALQLALVIAPDFDSFRARLQRYERRAANEPWKPVGPALPVVLGHKGYAWGDGLHGAGAPVGRGGPIKREGDGRSPAGVFALGTLHGYAPERPPSMRLPYRQASAADRCVDDPESEHYNRVVSIARTPERWRSAEHMRRDDDLYELALDIEHNRSPVVAQHGSCIFAHVWAGPDTPVQGCTALAKPDLQRLLRWLRPGEARWVALPESEYRALRGAWQLP